MAIEGQAELQQAQDQAAMSAAVTQEFTDNVWQPVHQFLLRHKLAADVTGYALDTIGVIAGGVFVLIAAPELIAAGTVMAGVALATGAAATLGSVVLFGTDSYILGAELFGHDAAARKFEDDKTIQWLRIGASIMLLPDMLVGGTRGLIEIGKLGGEAREAASATTEAARATEEARARIAKIRNPARHPDPVARRMRKVNAFEREAQAQARAVEDAHNRIRTVAVRDIGSFQGATLAGTGLLAAAPPGVLLSANQTKHDEDYMKTLAPRGGMPKDVRLEMRVTGFTTAKMP